MSRDLLDHYAQNRVETCPFDLLESYMLRSTQNTRLNRSEPKPKPKKTARSCRFALHNIRKIRPFLTEHAAQLLVQVLVISRLDYCNALLAGLPSNTIKPLQMIQNAAALVFNEPKRAHVTPLFVSLHWLPVAVRIQFKTLMLAYRITHRLSTLLLPLTITNLHPLQKSEIC